MTPLEYIGELAERGVIVSTGHSDADYATAVNAIDAGVTGFTHLFNAMSQLGGRAPGMVGAALDSGRTVPQSTEGVLTDKPAEIGFPFPWTVKFAMCAPALSTFNEKRRPGSVVEDDVRLKPVVIAKIAGRFTPIAEDVPQPQIPPPRKRISRTQRVTATVSGTAGEI